jgi:2-polyprenyl-3-methyl-5-hydroxy-6-metoxy-1,4-benzoquinol methylase
LYERGSQQVLLGSINDMDQEMTGSDTSERAEHLSKVQLYFDEHAEFWSDLYDRPESGNDRVLANRTKLAVRMITERTPVGSLVLDAGCGGGVASLALAMHGYRVHGLDIAADLLRHAELRLKSSSVPHDNWRVIHSDLLGAGYADHSFDAIVALGFIQYQPDEIRTLRELGRILKPGGHLVITGPTEHRLSAWLDFEKHFKSLRRRLSASKNAKNAKSSELQRVLEISPHHYSPARFRQLLTDSGFEVREYIGHGFGDYNRPLEKLARFLPIGRWANDLVFLATKRS